VTSLGAQGKIRTLFMTEEGAGEAGGGWHTSYLSSLPLGEDTRIVTVSEAAFKRLAGGSGSTLRRVLPSAPGALSLSPFSFLEKESFFHSQARR
jgi:hypothetical protein